MRKYYLSNLFLLVFFCLTNSVLSNFYIKTDFAPFLRPINDDSHIFDKYDKSPFSDKPKNLLLKTKNNIKVPALFFDRCSDTIIILGQGLPATKESMIVFAHLFDQYDVITFDYRWAGRYGLILFKSMLMANPVQKILYDEQQEMQAVLDFVQQKKSYKNIVGLGECYSNFLFAKMQAEAWIKPFTHLIFDSCWYSLKGFAESICKDPYLPLSPQDGGAPKFIKKITGSSLVMKLIKKLIPKVTIKKYLSALDAPCLCIYGSQDLMVSRKHFDKIWDALCQDKRAAFITPFQHADNIHNKQLYKFVCEQFIHSNSIPDFLHNCNHIIN